MKLNLPVKEPPKHTKKYVVWNNDNGTVVLLVGYCPDTLPYFMGLTNMLLTDFPKIDLNEIVFGKVRNSSWAKGFTIVTAKIEGPRRKIPGYVKRQWETFDVYF